MQDLVTEHTVTQFADPCPLLKEWKKNAWCVELCFGQAHVHVHCLPGEDMALVCKEEPATVQSFIFPFTLNVKPSDVTSVFVKACGQHCAR